VTRAVHAIDATRHPTHWLICAQVAGPLIRVGGDRFGGTVKAAVLEALAALLEVAPKLVKAFVPQLQATFAKALRDPALEVRRNGTTALGLLAPLSTRLDALVTDLSSGATADDAPDAVAAACLKGLKAVFANATGPKPPSDASRDAARDAAEALAGHEDPEVSKAAAALSSTLGG